MALFTKLENVEIAASHNPDTFFIPPKDERRNQKVGDSVRLHFLLENPLDNEPRAERMWVTITQEQSSFRPYKGTLENKPAYIQNLKLGDEITFKHCHIARTIIKKSDPRWIDSTELKAVVSDMCMQKDGVVRFLYREAPEREDDSGWRMFSGYESEQYTDDSKNIRIIDVGFMLDKDPSLLKPLKEGEGAVFEREDIHTQWKKVTDWEPCD